MTHSDELESDPEGDVPVADMDLDPTALFAEQEELPADHRSGFVAVIGRPNVGKSTLLNRLLGQKIAITSEKPQTTRDQILGIRTDADTQIAFLDTPGIHRPKNKLGKHMVRVAEETVSGNADVVLWVVDVTVAPTAEEEMIAQRLAVLHAERPLPPLLLGLNKLDAWQGNETALDRRREQYRGLIAFLADAQEGNLLPPHGFSATSGAGVDELLAILREQLPVGPRYYPEEQVTDLSLRFIAGEIVREKALDLLHHEVPHSLAVAVTDWEEREEGLTYIAATLYVERRSQKGIVLGRKGSMIKAIGQAARPEIEALVGQRVYLDLWVKVWEKWRRRDHLLQRLGYEI